MTMQVQPSKAMQTVRAFANDNGLSESYTWELIRRKRIRAVKIGRATRITAEDAAAFRAGLHAVGEAA